MATVLEELEEWRKMERVLPDEDELMHTVRGYIKLLKTNGIPAEDSERVRLGIRKRMQTVLEILF